MVPAGQGGHPDLAGSGATGSSTRGRVSSAAPAPSHGVTCRAAAFMAYGVMTTFGTSDALQVATTQKR